MVLALLLAGCTADDGEQPAAGPSPAAPSSPSASTPASGRPETSTPDPPRVIDLDPRVAIRTVRHLAGEIGPRMGTGPAHRRAARWVARRLDASGYDVGLRRFDVPAGVSWGVPVDAGRSENVVATPPGFDPTSPYLLVGAHLDSVPQSPGAEDNASGVGALLAVADALRARETRLPVVLVGFGAEEPRGPGDDDHHYGSRHHVAQMSLAERRNLRGMVSLDRVGVGGAMPVCDAGQGSTRVRDQLLRAARRLGVAAQPCSGNRASDHWSFVRNGLPAARLGSTSFAGYHSPGDVPSVVNRPQLNRAARITLAWLIGQAGRP